jgi:flagellar M-ring protein FliF
VKLLRERLQSWLNMLNDRWRGLTQSQKVRIAALGGIVLVALIITLVLTLRVNWVTTFTQADIATIGQIEAVLADANIRTNVDVDRGTVAVPAGDRDRARTIVHTSPVMLDQRFDFRDALDNLGMGVSTAAQHEIFTQALATDLERMLVANDGITDARVILNAPNASAIFAPRVPASASVQLRGPSLNSSHGEAAALTVSRGVQGLNLENIVVTDAGSMSVLFNDGRQQGGAGQGGALIFENSIAERLSRNVKSALTMFDEVNASSNIVVDWMERTREIMQFANPDGGASPGYISEESVRSVLGIMDDGTGGPGEAGAYAQDFPGGAAVPVFDGLGGAEGRVRMQEEEAVRSILHDWIRTVEQNVHPGRWLADDSSVHVNAFRYNYHSQQDLLTRGLLEEGEAAWLTFKAETGTSHMYQGDTALYENAIRNATGVNNISLLVYDLHFFEEMLPEPPLPLATIVLLSLLFVFIGLLAFGLVRRAQPQLAGLEEIEPELSVEDFLVSSQYEDEKEAEIIRLQEIKHSTESPVKEQIDKFTSEEPESVAHLLRNWINEDWE